MSLFDFIAENLIIVAGAVGMGVTALWGKIQPFMAKLFSPSPFQPSPPSPVVMPGLRPRSQPSTQPSDVKDAEDTLLAVTSVSYLIEYFKVTKNTKGEAHARSAAKSIFEANVDAASK